MATIRKEGFTSVPLLLGANALTETVATAIPSAAVLISSTVMHGPAVMPAWWRT
jgi:hypothetical protein